jgi:DnaJ-class molecular chaperone
VSVKVQLLDGKIFSFTTRDMELVDKSERTFPGKGMPIIKTGGYGNLIIKFKIHP